MPAITMSAWEQHFQTCPPGDFLLQHLIVDLIRVVETFAISLGGGDVSKVRDVAQIAPWMITAEQAWELANKRAERNEMARMEQEQGLEQDMERAARITRKQRAERQRAATARPTSKRRSTTRGKRRKA